MDACHHRSHKKFQGRAKAFELASHAGVPYIVVFHPLREEAKVGFSDLAPLVARLKQETTIPVVDLNAYFQHFAAKHGTQPQDLYWPINGHFTPDGYAIFAGGVWQALENLPEMDIFLSSGLKG